MTHDQLQDIEETLSDAQTEVYDADEGLAVLADYRAATDDAHADFVGRLHDQISKVKTAVEEVRSTIEKEKFSRRER